MRSVFFVPQPGTFTGADLTRLEAEAAANPGAKGALLRHLHVRRPPTVTIALISCLPRTSTRGGVLDISPFHNPRCYSVLPNPQCETLRAEDNLVSRILTVL